MIFNTERLSIRKLKTSDIKEFHDMLGNPNVMKYVKTPLTLKASELELQKFIDLYSNPSKFYNIWAVDLKESSKLIGICGVYENTDGEHEIAYRLRELFWGNGFGNEICEALINYCNTNLNLNKLVAYVHPENTGSIKILERHMISKGSLSINGNIEKKFERINQKVST